MPVWFGRELSTRGWIWVGLTDESQKVSQLISLKTDLPTQRLAFCVDGC